MSFTMEDSPLESGWVSVRPNVFEETERHKFAFIVAWNDVEGKFAVTCHDRTVQRRSAFRDSLFDCAASAEKHRRDDANGSHDVALKVASKSNSVATKSKGEDAVRGPPPPPPRPRRAPESLAGKALGSWDVLSSPSRKAMDHRNNIEVLEPEEEEEDFPGELLASPDNCDTKGKGARGGEEEEDEEEEEEEYSWAGLFSFQDLRAAHAQLCAVNSDLEPCLPAFPEDQRQSGTLWWSVIFGAGGAEVTGRETDALCYQVQVYLGHALDTCGWKILSQVLFAESDDDTEEEYYESLSELRQKGYEDALERAKTRLQELLERHRGMDSMVELLQVYLEEDQAYGDLLEATTQLYQYLLQPFRDMRELAMLRRQQIKISLETERLGPRRVDALTREDDEWQRKAHAAVLSIQNLTTKFFETTTRAQKAMYERMRADQRKFGKAAWAAAAGRMEQLQYAVSKETLQLMRAKEICLEQRKHGLKEEMQSLQAGDGAMRRLDQLEALYYALQLQLYDIQAEVLRCEELLLTAQLASLRRQMTERQDEVVYYDAYESPDAMRGVEEEEEEEEGSVGGGVGGGTGGGAPAGPLSDEQLVALQHKTRQLEARRGRITSKRAYLKNKKEICIVNHNQKRHGSQADGDSIQALHQRAADEEEETRSAHVGQERRRTLLGLRNHSQRFPGQVTLKSSRLRLGLPHSRRRPGPRTTETSTQVASVQTDHSLELSPGHYSSDGHQRASSLPAACLGGPRSLSSLPPPSRSCSTSADLSPSSASAPPLAPPPPPLPPPPPPPSLEDLQGEGVDGSRSPGVRAGDGGESLPLPLASLPLASLPLAPFSPRFFDSSQLLNARKKLKKTASLDSTQWRRAGSPMDEVLASLKRGCFRLRKAELRVLPDPDDDDVSNNILAQIRQGVLLRKVRSRPADQQQQHRHRQQGTRGFPPSADALTRSIHEALRRIKEASPESESEDEGLPCTDWEN